MPNPEDTLRESLNSAGLPYVPEADMRVWEAQTKNSDPEATATYTPFDSVRGVGVVGGDLPSGLAAELAEMEREEDERLAQQAREDTRTMTLHSTPFTLDRLEPLLPRYGHRTFSGPKDFGMNGVKKSRKKRGGR